MRKILLVLFMCFISSYAFSAKDANWVIKKVKVEEDSFAKIKRTIFPKIDYRQVSPSEVKEKTGISVWSSPNFTYNIIIVEDLKTNIKTIKIMTKENLLNLAGDKDFPNYTKALDAQGVELNFQTEEKYEPKKYGSAFKQSYPSETFSITITKDYLEKFREDGLVIKIYGERESPIYHISSFYIDGVLKYLDKADK